MRIREGEFYVDGYGNKIGPMYLFRKDSMGSSGTLTDGTLWGLDGKRFYPISRGLSCLVSEWVEPFTIEVGKYYNTRGGLINGPVESFCKDNYPFICKGFTFTREGRHLLWSVSERDLVSEASPPEPEIVWGEWVYDRNKWFSVNGVEQCEKGEDSFYLRHRTPKRARVTGSVEVDSEGEPDFSTWTET